MKRFVFIFLLICPLWACTSCDDEDKLPGSKPEMLLGTWERSYIAGFPLPLWNMVETYEFTKKGGEIIRLEYFPEEDRYEVDYTRNFTDWSYQGETIYFLRKKGSFTERWTLSVEELTDKSALLGGVLFYKK